MLQKSLAIALILLGEVLSIVAEVVAARTQARVEAAAFATPFLVASGAMVLAGVLLIAGYMLGVRAFRDIWVVGVISLGSIVITEPIVNWLVFRELPTRGPLIGMVLAVCAIASATLVK